MYTPGLTSIVFKQSSNILKFNILATWTVGPSVGEKDGSSGFNSCVKAVVLLTFMTYNEKFINN